MKKVLFLLLLTLTCSANAFNGVGDSFDDNDMGSERDAFSTQGHSHGGSFSNASQGAKGSASMTLADLEKKAEAGNVQAQIMLADMYERGEHGLPKDPAKSAYWFKKASDQGNPLAQFMLGTDYLYGTGVTKDHVKAVDLFEKSAAQGVTASQFNLAYAYEVGDVKAKDINKAKQYYKQSCDGGFQEACKEYQRLIKK